MDKIDLQFVQLSKDNVKIAGKIQYEIFPNSACYNLYLEEVEEKRHDYFDYLIYYKDNFIGVIGYSLDQDDEKTAWGSWFGILPQYREKGLAIQALEKLYQILRQNKFEIFRLFTYEVWNAIAQPLYNKHMDFGEYYKNKDDNQYDIEVGKCKIFTKSLTGKKAEPWNDKFIDIGSEDILHEKSVLKLKEDKII